MADVLVSGFRPTGRLHLGHLRGTLDNWTQLQERFLCYFFVADWHALTTGFEETGGIEASTRDMVADWLAVGLDPKRSVIFRQSSIPEHAELHLVFSMLTPVPWLIRNPTIKEQARELGLIQSDDEAEMTKINYGLLGYPVLQAADVLLYKAGGVPVGADQVPHIELMREIARRFNHLYRDVFPEPKPILSEAPKILGLDGRKMSKSYGNAVFLSDPLADVDAKLSRMITDPRRARRKDPGDPKDCPAFQSFHKIYCTPEELAYQEDGCKTARIGCLECKKIMIRHVLDELRPIQERRKEIVADAAAVDRVLEEGNARAAEVAKETIREMRSAIGFGPARPRAATGA